MNELNNTVDAWAPSPNANTAFGLLERLESPLEVLTNLNFLALQEEAACPGNVRRFLHMADDQMKVIHRIMEEINPHGK